MPLFDSSYFTKRFCQQNKASKALVKGLKTGSCIKIFQANYSRGSENLKRVGKKSCCLSLSQEGVRKIKLVQLFDPALSPRCFAISATKQLIL